MIRNSAVYAITQHLASNLLPNQPVQIHSVGWSCQTITIQLDFREIGMTSSKSQHLLPYILPIPRNHVSNQFSCVDNFRETRTNLCLTTCHTFRTDRYSHGVQLTHWQSLVFPHESHDKRPQSSAKKKVINQI